jgi:hypothetical protein
METSSIIPTIQWLLLFIRRLPPRQAPPGKLLGQPRDLQAARETSPDWLSNSSPPPFTLRQTLLSVLPSLFLSKICIRSPAKATRPQSPLPPDCTSLQLISFPLQSSVTSFNMFRNALRQSSRAVGAVSAAGRVAAVSLLTPSRSDFQTPIEPPQATRCRHRDNAVGAQLGIADIVASIVKLFLSCAVALGPGGVVHSLGFRLTCFSPPDSKCRTGRRQRCRRPLIRLRGQGIPDRGFLHSRAAHSRRPGGVWSC